MARGWKYNNLNRFIVGIMCFAQVQAVNAACTTPAGVAGGRNYKTATNKYQVCNGTSWVDMANNGSMGSCSKTAELEYDAGEAVYRYCNGTTWIRAEKATCTISSMTYVSKVTDATALLYQSAAFISADKSKLYTVGSRVTKWTVTGSPPALSKTGHSATNSDMSVGQEIRVYGNYAWVAGNGGYMTVWDISGATPTFVVSRTTATMGGGLNGLELSDDGTKAYTATYDVGGKCYFHSWNISTPTTLPVPTALDLTAYTGGYCTNVQLRGDYAFVNFQDKGLGQGGIVAIDITNNTVVGSVSNANFLNANGFWLSPDKKYAYTSPGSNTAKKMTVTDISDPTAMVYKGRYTQANLSESYDLTTSGRYTFFTSVTDCYTYAVDVTDPTTPVQAAVATGCTNANAPAAMAITGQYLIVAGYAAESLSVFNLGCDPSLPPTSLGVCSRAGQIDYFTGTNTLAWCDGSDWRPMH